MRPLMMCWATADFQPTLWGIWSYVCGYRDQEWQKLSDFTCTALQLANFWQDVSVDYAKGRIYLPLEDMQHYKVSERDIAATQNTASFCEMMRFEVEIGRASCRERV